VNWELLWVALVVVGAGVAAAGILGGFTWRDRRRGSVHDRQKSHDVIDRADYEIHHVSPSPLAALPRTWIDEHDPRWPSREQVRELSERTEPIAVGEMTEAMIQPAVYQSNGGRGKPTKKV